jgi:hypothetical protein
MELTKEESTEAFSCDPSVLSDRPRRVLVQLQFARIYEVTILSAPSGFCVEEVGNNRFSPPGRINTELQSTVPSGDSGPLALHHRIHL